MLKNPLFMRFPRLFMKIYIYGIRQKLFQKGCIFLRKITKEQWEELRKAGLIREKRKKNGIITQEPNFCIANRQHKSRAKTYFVVEEPRIMKFLDKTYNKQKPFNPKRSKSKQV